MLRILTALLCLMLLCAFSLSAGDTQQKRDAIHFILGKLNQEDGAGWQRAGQYFYWSYHFDSSGCELEVTRRDAYGYNNYDQTIPLAETQPAWLGESTLRF